MADFQIKMVLAKITVFGSYKIPIGVYRSVFLIDLLFVYIY